jgi:peptide/nickel transport system ATP-binding protein
LVEVAARDTLFATPAHPYTRTLLGRTPAQVDEPAEAPVSGGCAFHDRCAYAQASCLLAIPPLQEVSSGHFAACHRWREVVYS